MCSLLFFSIAVCLMVWKIDDEYFTCLNSEVEDLRKLKWTSLIICYVWRVMVLVRGIHFDYPAFLRQGVDGAHVYDVEKLYFCTLHGIENYRILFVAFTQIYSLPKVYCWINLCAFFILHFVNCFAGS